MSKWKQWMMIGMVTLTGAVSLGSDCDLSIIGDEDGFSVDLDDDDDGFFDDLEDFFD